MDFIKSILPLTDSGKLSKFLGNSSQLKHFHDLIRSQKVTTEEEAFLALYGKNGSKIAFKKLKQRLRDRLTEYVVQYGVTYRNLDDYGKLYRKCMSKVLAVKTLISSNARTAAVEIGEDLIKTTIRNEYTDLTLLLSRELFTHYSVINYNKVKLKKYERIATDTELLYQRELEVNRYYCYLRSEFSTARGSIKTRLLNKATEYSKKAEVYRNAEIVSYQLLLLCYLLLTMRHELAKDYHLLLDICNEATETFTRRKISRKFVLYQFDLYRIVCNIQLGNNIEAERIAKDRLRLITRGHLNWFVLLLYTMVSKLHSKDYGGAYDILNEVRSEKNYKKLPQSHLQIFVVYEAHIEFLLAIGKVSAEQNSKFRLYKFLNEIPIYTRDKRGLNISVLIVHVLFLLHQGKFSQIIDRVDALNQYCHRHLRRDETFRSNCFIKMLLQIAKADFNRKRAERYAQPYIKKLESMPLAFSDQSIEVEIIPYEDLWRIVLDLLK